MKIAIAIASKDGAKHISHCLYSCLSQADTYVVSDGSSDDTAAVASFDGAQVLELTENIGKPAAISALINEFELDKRYEYVAVVDDDTVLAPDFIKEMGIVALRQNRPEIINGAVAAQSDKRWWNPWLAGRALAYWRQHVTYRRGCSAVGAMTYVSGASSMYKCPDTLNLWHKKMRYIVDDTEIGLDVNRSGGRIKYAPHALAYVQDPSTIKAWWKQNVRWMWGTFQGVRGHKVGCTKSWFDLVYLGILLDTLTYVLSPLAVAGGLILLHWSLLWLAIGMIGVPLLWTLAAAVRLRRPSLILHLPHIILLQDLLYRGLLVYCVYKTWRRPTIERCVWDSPKRN